MDRPRTVEITERREIAPGISRFLLDTDLDFRPGQFAMVWVPGVDEIPLSIVGGDPLEFIVHGIGDATETMNRLDPGDLLGIRGPYGTGFTATKGRALLVAGGVGSAPLIPLARELDRFDAVLGAQTADLLVGTDDLDADVSTDDGTAGFHGFVTELAAEKGLENYDTVYSCGPEVMMTAVLDMCVDANVAAQFSMERYMKCGIGICGSCCVDPTGERVCAEGPVFTAEHLESTEFGRYHRDGSGARHAL